jgi:hypothetical protein
MAALLVRPVLVGLCVARLVVARLSGGWDFELGVAAVLTYVAFVSSKWVSSL